jgi:CheY-like chemotaxis protein
VRDIWNSGRHLLELLNEILDLSKVEAGQMVLEPTTFEVTAALEYTLSLVRERAAQHSITVTLVVEPGLDAIEADELRFKQVVLNLASNAVKFTPDGGRVDVTAQTDRDELTVTVHDTGTGIPEEDRERIFESFQQGGRGVTREEGTGLGLTLTRRIVELFGGRLWLESEVGVGSTFGFSLPVRPRDVPAPMSQDADRATRVTVLLVDDDRSSVDLVSAYLEGSPVRLGVAQDGIEAIRMAEELEPDVIVLDIRLPGLDGWQVMAALQERPSTSGIPIVVATVIDDRARGVAMGADAYLLKPVSRETLLDALASVGVPVRGTEPVTQGPA